MDTIPITSPFSTTGRWRKFRSSMILRASSTCSPGPTVTGSPVIHEETACEGASCDCEIARTVSRSVKMPARRVPSMTSIAPTLCCAISATASPTVVDGWTVKSDSLMTSRTVAMAEVYAWPGGIGKAASPAVAARTRSTTTPSARAFGSPRFQTSRDMATMTTTPAVLADTTRPNRSRKARPSPPPQPAGGRSVARTRMPPAHAPAERTWVASVKIAPAAGLTWAAWPANAMDAAAKIPGTTTQGRPHRSQPADHHQTDEADQAYVLEPVRHGQRDVERRHAHGVGEFQPGFVIAVSTCSSHRPSMSRYAGARPSTLNPQRSSTAALRAFPGMWLAATRCNFHVSNANATAPRTASVM